MPVEIPGWTQGVLAYIALELIKTYGPRLWDRYNKRRERMDETTAELAIKKFENGVSQRKEENAELKETRAEIRRLERENLQLLHEKGKAEFEKDKVDYRCVQLEERVKALETQLKNK